jgi:O-antigen/teichoic acid export membrane protein
MLRKLLGDQRFNFLQPGATLTAKTLQGGFWVFVLRGVERCLFLARIAILARLLEPSDFGLLGIALLTIATLETFSQTGFDIALIQKKDDTSTYLNTAWTAMIIRGIALYTLLLLGASYSSAFFDSSGSKSIIQVIGLSVLLQSFTNIGVIYFQKDLKFNKHFIYQFSGTLIDFLVAITAAFLLRNVWALVYGMLAGNFVRLVLSYIIHPYRPRLSFNLSQTRELFDFGKWIWGSSIILFLLTQGDNILVGKLFGVAMLGYYQMAYRISSLPATEISHVISQVTFPAYSKLRDNTDKLREAYTRVLQLVAFLSLPLTGLLYVLAGDLTLIFLGGKWLSIVPLVQILSIFGLIRAFNATTGPLFHAVGRPSKLTRVSFIQLVFLGIIIYPLATVAELVGVSWAVVLSNLVCLFLAFRETFKILNLKMRDIVIILKPSLLGSLCAIALVFLVKSFVQGYESAILTLVASLSVGIGIYSLFAKAIGFSISSFLNTGRVFNYSNY